MQGDPSLEQDAFMATASKPLNAEPSQPQDRAHDGLPPKSYKAAAEESLPNGHARTSESEHPVGDRKKTHGVGVEAQSNREANTKGEEERKSWHKPNGSSMTTMKPSQTTNIAREGELEKHPQSSRQDELVTGREAGQRWRRSPIRFAPLNVPLQRRLQTLMVLLHSLSIAGLFAIFLFLAAIPLLWPILVPYLIFCSLSNAGVSGELSHRSERLRRAPIWSLFASYFPARLHRTEELPPTRKYVFGVSLSYILCRDVPLGTMRASPALINIDYCSTIRTASSAWVPLQPSQPKLLGFPSSSLASPTHS